MRQVLSSSVSGTLRSTSAPVLVPASVTALTPFPLPISIPSLTMWRFVVLLTEVVAALVAGANLGVDGVANVSLLAALVLAWADGSPRAKLGELHAHERRRLV